MKSMKKLVPAIAMLIISAVLMSTASYAWFSMSREVSATGITMTAKAPTNLLISTDGGSTWGDTKVFDESYTGKLYPASSTDGKTFHAVIDESYIQGGVGGVAEVGTVFMKDANVIAMSGANNGWYAVYTLDLKTTGEDTVTVSLASIDVIATSSQTITLLEGDNASSYYTTAACTVTGPVSVPEGGGTYYIRNILEDCVRVSIYDGATLMGIWAVDDTQAVDPVSAVTYDVDEFVSYTLNGDDVLEANTVSVAPNAVKTLTVYVWIEGQNPNTVNAVAGQNFNIGLTFEGVDA